jgi:hypothetical protein
MEVLLRVLNVTVQCELLLSKHSLLLSKLEMLNNTVNVTNIPFLHCSVAFFHCGYLTPKNVPIPPLLDQNFTPKIR